MTLSRFEVGAMLQRLLLASGDEIPAYRRGWDLTDDGRSVPLDDAAFERLPEIVPVSLFATLLRNLATPGSSKVAQEIGYGLCACEVCDHVIVIRYPADLSLADARAAMQAT